MRDIYIAEVSGGGLHVYTVMVNGKPYDTFDSNTPLTWSQQDDVVSGYREALDGGE